jgi:hypothetical protein
MCKDNEIVLKQKDNFGEIFIERVEVLWIIKQ